MIVSAKMPTDKNKPPRGRPRDPSADDAILEATLDAFIAHGYDGMSLESVAARARVGKTTIYRRWDTKEDLVLAAVERLYESLEIPDTGDVRRDLTSLVRQAHAFITLTRAGDVLPRMAGELASGTPLGLAYMKKVMTPRLVQVKKVLDSAKQRGEIRSSVDTDVAVAEIIGAMMFLRFTRKITTAGRDLPDRLVHQVMMGLRPTSGTSRRKQRHASD